MGHPSPTVLQCTQKCVECIPKIPDIALIFNCRFCDQAKPSQAKPSNTLNLSRLQPNIPIYGSVAFTTTNHEVLDDNKDDVRNELILHNELLGFPNLLDLRKEKGHLVAESSTSLTYTARGTPNRHMVPSPGTKAPISQKNTSLVCYPSALAAHSNRDLASRMYFRGDHQANVEGTIVHLSGI